MRLHERFCNLLKMNRFHECLCGEPHESSLNSYNGKISILCRRGDMFLCRQMGEKGADFWRPHIFRMAFLVKENKASHPADIRLFRAYAEMFEA